MDAANFRHDTPHGPIYGYISEKGLRELHLPNLEHPLSPYMLHSRPNHVLGRRLGRMLADYFAGIRLSFSEIPLDLSMGTPFQQAVWMALQDIPYGETVTYGMLAARLGKHNAARAVGGAVGANPVCIVVPCHRVLAAGGKIGGFSAGLAWKERLLLLEGNEEF